VDGERNGCAGSTGLNTSPAVLRMTENGLDAGAWRRQNSGGASRGFDYCSRQTPGADGLGESTLSSGAVSQTGTSERSAAGSGLPPEVRQSAGLRRWWWLGALLVVASLIVGGTVVHVVGQRHAQRVLYDIQVLTTASRFLDEERGQIALPVAQRNAGALGDLADSIDADLGVNGEGTLQVTTGSGSTATFTQIAFEVTVSSPYASTTFVVWLVRGGGPGGMNSQNAGACVLSSSLVGSERATSFLNLGASGLQPCWPQLWSASSKSPMQPHLAWADIPQSVGS
jgi:hypothetical protein